MFTQSGLIRARSREPWLRLALVVLLLLVLLVMLAMAWHRVGMADHSMMMLGACMAVLASAVLLLVGSHREDSIPDPTSTPLLRVERPTEFVVLGRHPPQEGTVLLD